MSEINLEPSLLEIEHALEMLLPKLQNLLNDHYSKNYEFIGAPELQVKKGSKYWKLITVDNNQRFTSKSVFAFIRRADGAILRAATFSSPELRTKDPVRGYITDDDCMQWFSTTGVRYASY